MILVDVKELIVKFLMIWTGNHMLFNVINEKLRDWQTEKTLNVGIQFFHSSWFSPLVTWYNARLLLNHEPVLCFYVVNKN